ncbi:MAG: putative sulfate/molybdate transporter [Planctomycetota bacterium]
MIRFDRNELAGAFGDIGTDLPLITAMLLATDLHPASVLTIFGIMQIFAALLYRMPMPVQPLKAVAAIVIVQNTSSSVIFGGGLAIGIIMGILSLSGFIEYFGRIIPKAVVRGIQFGLGNKKYPAALLIIPIGLIYAFALNIDFAILKNSFGIQLPQVEVPTWTGIVDGFLLLALAQIPLSLGNSIYATKQIADDLYPDKKVGLRKIGLSYSIINIISPFFSAIPLCHGSGGFTGHYTFGGRTGGSVIIYGSIFITLGLFFSQGFSDVIKIFPSPILGIILFFEALVLMKFIKDLSGNKFEFLIAILVGVIAANVPYGFLIGMFAGIIIIYSSNFLTREKIRDKML